MSGSSEIALTGDTVWIETTSAPTGALVQAFALEGAATGQEVGDGLSLAVGLSTLLAGAGDAHLLAADGAQLEIVDVRDPARPQGVAAVDLPGPVTAATWQGDRLWVAWRSPAGATGSVTGGGIELFDVSDPRWPESLAARALGAAPIDLDASTGHVWVATDALQAYEVQGWMTPVTPPPPPTTTATPLAATPVKTPTPTSAVTPTPPRPSATPAPPGRLIYLPSLDRSPGP